MYNIIAAVSLLALCGALVLFACSRDRQAFKLTFWLFYFGLSTTLLYLFSSRFARDAGFPPRYILVLAVCAFASVCLVLVQQVRRLEMRLISVGALLGFSFALLATDVGLRGRGPALESLDVLKFLRAASNLRATCDSDDDAWTYGANVWSPLILCKKIDLIQGEASFPKAKIWTGWADRVIDPAKAPRIYAGGL
jgi:hypothetical protein